MYLAGVSVRRVEDITQSLWGTRVSPCTVSNLNQKIYKRIEKWRNRPIEQEFAYLYLDGIVLKRTWADEVRRRTRVVGAFPDGNSALMLVSARLRHIAGTRWGTPRYLNMDLLKEIETKAMAA